MAGNILGTLLINIVSQANTGGLDKTNQALKRTSKNISSMSKNMSFLANLSKGFLGYFSVRGLWNMFSGYTQFEKDLGAIHSRFYAITNDEKKAVEEFGWIRKLAKETAQDINSTAEGYSIFYSAVQKSLGSEGAREVYSNWAKVGRVLHLSQYQMERVTYALREMASKGAIYSQDLRMQIGTHVPNAMGLAQKASEEMGITGLNWFEQLQQKAKGNSKITAEFIRRFSKNAEKMYASESAFKKAMEQPDALMQTIKNMTQEILIDFSNAGGREALVNLLWEVKTWLEGFDYRILIKNLGKIAKLVSKIAYYIPSILKLLKNILIAIVAYQTIKGVGGFIKGFSEFAPFKSKNIRFFDRVIWGLINSGKTGTKIADTLLNFTGGTALKGILKGALGVSLGYFAVLPLIYDIMKYLRDKWIDKETKKMFESGMFLDSGFTNQQIYEIMKQANSKNFSNPLELQNFLIKSGYGSVIDKFTYYNGETKVYVYKDNFDEESFAEQMQLQKGEVLKSNINQYFENPNIFDKIQNIFYSDSVGKQSRWTPLKMR